jgi:hypothetical protein
MTCDTRNRKSERSDAPNVSIPLEGKAPVGGNPLLNGE